MTSDFFSHIWAAIMLHLTLVYLLKPFGCWWKNSVWDEFQVCPPLGMLLFKAILLPSGISETLLGCPLLV